MCGRLLRLGCCDFGNTFSSVGQPTRRFSPAMLIFFLFIEKQSLSKQSITKEIDNGNNLKFCILGLYCKLFKDLRLIFCRWKNIILPFMPFLLNALVFTWLFSFGCLCNTVEEFCFTKLRWICDKAKTTI